MTPSPCRRSRPTPAPVSGARRGSIRARRPTPSGCGRSSSRRSTVSAPHTTARSRAANGRRLSLRCLGWWCRPSTRRDGGARQVCGGRQGGIPGKTATRRTTMEELPDDGETVRDDPAVDDALVEEQEAAAAAEAARIGGASPSRAADPARAPSGGRRRRSRRLRAGGGRARPPGSHEDPGTSPSQDAFEPEAESDSATAVFGEPDEVDPTEVTSDPAGGPDDPGKGPGIAAGVSPATDTMPRPMRQRSPETYEEKLAQLNELREQAIHTNPRPRRSSTPRASSPPASGSRSCSTRAPSRSSTRSCATAPPSSTCRRTGPGATPWSPATARSTAARSASSPRTSPSSAARSAR